MVAADRPQWAFLADLDLWMTQHPEGPTGWVPPWHPRRVAARRLHDELHECPANRSGVSTSEGDPQTATLPESG